MVNKALLEASMKLAAKEEAGRAEAKKNAQRRNPKGFPTVTRMISGEPSFISTLVNPSLNLRLHIHFDFVPTPNGKAKGYFAYKICHKTYQEIDPDYVDCPTCQELNKWNKNKTPSEIIAIPVYNHSNEGKTYKGKNEKGEEDDIPVGTEEILLYRPGDSKANFIEYDNFNLKNMLVPGKAVFKVGKIGEEKETKYNPLTIQPKEMLGDEFDPDSPQAKAARAKWAKLSPDDVYQRILAVFTNSSVDWELWGIDEPKAEEVKSDSKADKPQEKIAKNGLN